MRPARSSSWAVAALVAIASLVASVSTAAAVREVEQLASFSQLATLAAADSVESRQHERKVLAMIQRGEDAQALVYLEALALRDAALAARLHESLAGAYVRDRRLYRATQHLDAIPPARRSDQAWFLVGNIAARQQRLPAALDAFGRVAQRQPDDPLVARDEAQIASLLGQPARAAAACERLLRRVPGDVEATLLLARLRVQQGRMADAERLLTVAQAREPRHGRVALQLGMVQLTVGKPQAARQSLAKARTLEPARLPPHVAAAAVLLSIGDTEAALASSTAALRVNASDPLAALVGLLATSGPWPPSRPGNVRFLAAGLHPDLETDPLPESVREELASTGGRARVAVVHVLSDLLDPRAALHWLGGEPGQAVQPLLELAAMRAEMAAGDIRAAEARLEALVRGNTSRGMVGPAIQAGVLASRRNDRAGARAAIDRALALAPTSPRVHMLAGDLHLVLGQPALAIPAYRYALGHWPRDPRLLNQLAHALALAGAADERVQALGMVQTALAQQPHYLLRAALLDTRADLLFRLGRQAEALAAYRELSTTVGGVTTPEQWHRIGDLARGAGDASLARTAYEEALDYGREYPGRADAIRWLDLPSGRPQE
jgi:tetratricopeptide (TPR) repeat protein